MNNIELMQSAAFACGSMVLFFFWWLFFRPAGRKNNHQTAKIRFALLLVFTLAACGSGITQTAQTERYNIEITLDSASFGERTATIAVNDRSGQPAAVDQVVLAPVMEMGMAVPELTAQPTAPGRYQIKGEFFSMPGEWQMNVRVSAAGKDDMARFLFQVQQ